MARNVGLNLIGCSIAAMVFIIGVTEATDYKVGDSFGWNIPTNESFYTDWASTKRFFVGDRLIFDWSGDHTVRDEKEATAYNNCSTSASGIESASPVTYNISETGPHYFLCTVGNHCARGQKFSINVESLNPISQPSSAPSILPFGILSTFLSSLAMYLFSRTS